MAYFKFSPCGYAPVKMLIHTLLLISGVQAAFKFPHALDEEIMVLPVIPGAPVNPLSIAEQEAHQAALIQFEHARRPPARGLAHDTKRILLKQIRDNVFTDFAPETRWILGMRVSACMENTLHTCQDFGKCVNEAVTSIGHVLNPVLFPNIHLIYWAAFEGNFGAIEWLGYNFRVENWGKLAKIFKIYLLNGKSTLGGFQKLVMLLIHRYKVNIDLVIPAALKALTRYLTNQSVLINSIFRLRPTFANFDLIVDALSVEDNAVFLNAFLDDRENRGRLEMVWPVLLKTPKLSRSLSFQNINILCCNALATDNYDHFNLLLSQRIIVNTHAPFNPHFLTPAQMVFQQFKAKNIATGLVRNHPYLLSTELRGSETTSSMYLALEMLGDEAFNALLTGPNNDFLFQPLIVDNEPKQWIPVLVDIYHNSGVPTHQAILEYLRLVPFGVAELDAYLADPEAQLHPEVLLKLAHELVIGEITETHCQLFKKAVQCEAIEALAYLVRIHGIDLNEVVVDGEVTGNALRLVEFSAPVLSKMIELGVDMNSMISINGEEIPVLVFLASRSDPEMAEVLYSHTGYSKATLEACLPIARSRSMYGLLRMLVSRLK